MELPSVFVVGIKTREGLQNYGGPTPRESEALACYCVPGAWVIYFERPDSPGVDAWRAVNGRWERCPGWHAPAARGAPRSPGGREANFNHLMQELDAERESRRKGTREHLR